MGALPRLGAGAVVAGYRVGVLRGVGASGVVYRAERLSDGALVALKVLPPRRPELDETLDKIVRQTRIASALHHPAVVEVLEVVECPEPPCVIIAMEWLDGPSLEELWGWRPRPDEALAIALQLVAALEATHAAGVVHRDVKPGNVVFARDPRERAPGEPLPAIKLVDFGLAKLANRPSGTRAGVPMGTPAYMAPEQVVGASAGPPADVFAAGTMMAELFGGQRPYPYGSVEEVLRAKIRRVPPQLGPIRGPFTTGIEALIRACLAHDPLERPTLERVRAGLEEAAAAEATLEPPTDGARTAIVEGPPMDPTRVDPPVEPTRLLGASDTQLVGLREKEELTRLVTLLRTKAPVARPAPSRPAASRAFAGIVAGTLTGIAIALLRRALSGP